MLAQIGFGISLVEVLMDFAVVYEMLYPASSKHAPA
jgi:hypothetical protein